MAGSGERRAVMSILSKCWYVPFCSSATGPPNLPDLPEFTRSPATLSAQYHCLTYLFRWGAAHACSLAPSGRERPSTRGYVDKDLFLFRKSVFSSSLFFVEKVWHNGGLFAPKSFTPGECQDLCLQSVGCVGFNWFPNMNCTLFTNLDRDVGKVRGAVRGHPSCKGKGLVSC